MTATTVPGVEALAPRWRRVVGGPLLVVAVTALVGFLLVGQLSGSERLRQRLQAENEGDLTRILAGLTSEADALRDEISTLKLQLLQLESTQAADSASTEAAEAQLRALRVLAGTVPVAGPGLSLVVEDPEDAVTYDTLIDIVQELRDAGAEAIAINDRRVGATSAFAERGDDLVLDGFSLTAPYRVVAIGPAATLEGGLKIPGGALDTLSSLRGVEARLQRVARLVVPALSRPPTFRVGRPVTSDE